MLERDGFVPGVPAGSTAAGRNLIRRLNFTASCSAGSSPTSPLPRYPASTWSHGWTARWWRIGVGETNPANPTWNTYIQVDDADASAKAILEAGGAVITEPFDAGEAGRMGVFADPAGAVFSIWQPGKLKGAELVNAPGSWNSSDLHTTDVEGAKSFYRAVFGREAQMLEFAGMRSWFSGCPNTATSWSSSIRRFGAARPPKACPPGSRTQSAGWRSSMVNPVRRARRALQSPFRRT